MGPELRAKLPAAEEPLWNQAESSSVSPVESLCSPLSATRRFACRTRTPLGIQSYSSGRILICAKTSGSDTYGRGRRPGPLTECRRLPTMRTGWTLGKGLFQGAKAYDIRFMFANELEEYLALAQDRTELAEAQERAERDREEEEAAGEDFGATSG